MRVAANGSSAISSPNIRIIPADTTVELQDGKSLNNTNILRTAVEENNINIAKYGEINARTSLSIMHNTCH